MLEVIGKGCGCVECKSDKASITYEINAGAFNFYCPVCKLGNRKFSVGSISKYLDWAQTTLLGLRHCAELKEKFL